MTKINLSGLLNVADADLVNTLQPDMASVILAPGHRYSVGIMTAMQIREQLDKNIPLYGVFDDQNVMDILTFFDNGVIQGVQLPSQTTEDAVTLLHDRGVPVIQVREPVEVMLEAAADIILIDTAATIETSFDWQSVPPKPLRKKPIMLAGDWTVDNLQTVMTQVQPEWVAIATAVEGDGVKNPTLLSQLVTIAHQN
ncbi:phosphoribosylanthranilate isomerase [Leuconostoc lactis]|uniref:phosphoribosylanthranilate isomerase n=1 Tax=Leuconostoc lactis TaxID=1246 RepID=UPI00189C26F6|nr:phosphoribosylanthranilate isomerase [Leuconostoc lactis]